MLVTLYDDGSSFMVIICVSAFLGNEFWYKKLLF